MDNQFVHLHVHTQYSLLDGSSKIDELTKQAKDLGMSALAITDHGVMYGVIDFYRACLANGIKPIIGCEVYVAPNSRFDREKSSGEDRYYHLVLLAENDLGYHNLMKIVSLGFTEGFYYKPRVDYEVLERFHEGVIALSACLAGEVSRNLVRGFYEEAKDAALHYQKIFGKDNFFLEMQDHGIPEQKDVNQGMLRLSEELGIDLVCTNDIHYTFADDEKAHDILLCIQTGKKVSDTNRMRYEGGQYYCKSEEEMRSLFPYAPLAIENTKKIADRCNVTIEFGVQKLPKYEVPKGYTSWEYLKYLCETGFNRRYPHADEKLRERLSYELNIIKNMGYVDYFLVVWDFIHYARQEDIIVGPGRGSAAGSIVAYSLEITNIDPIRYQLLFERFLNPERVSMPDIDVDFCFERRQEVIDYVGRKYGKDRVVQIVTFGTMAARGVIRDVGRALDLPYALCDSTAKMIPQELNITIDKALTMNPELKKAYENDREIHQLIDMSKRLEGLPRHTSMHAAGVVISQEPTWEYVPLSRGSDGSVTTQYVMTTLEELGLLKMDFLGLRTLTVIQNAEKLINRKEKILDMENIDYNDAAVLDHIGTGHTEGIFQLESAGMKNFMKELKPKSLEDIIAGISLYRPGPMDFIPKYLKGKNNPEAITYDCQALIPILKPTYGCIVYQEQVMQIVRDLGGFSLGRSDLLRRAMSKKKSAVMEKERKNFVYGNEEEGVKGCVNNGISEEVANKIYEEMIDFAKYAFNKSHAAAYAVVSYQTAYLKHYYPVEYMAALLNSVIDNLSKITGYILNCRELEITILPPDINEGEWGFSVADNSIRYGLSAIKGVGRNVVDAIVAERNVNGKFKSLKDFIYRLSNKEVNKRTVENFIKAGAFDSLPGNRKQKMAVYAGIIDQKGKEGKTMITGQMSLFDLFSPKEGENNSEENFPKTEEFPKEEILAFEKEVLGIYISGHPLDDWHTLWEKQISATTLDFMVDEEIGVPMVRDGASVTVGGMISGKNIKFTKNNQRMAFIQLEDLVGSVEVVVFPRDFEKNEQYLQEDEKVFIRGRVNVSEETAAKLICEKVTPFTLLPRQVWLQFKDLDDYEEKKSKLLTLLDEFSGNSPIILYLSKERARKTLPSKWNIVPNHQFLSKINEFLGVDNVKVVDMPIEKK